MSETKKGISAGFRMGRTGSEGKRAEPDAAAVTGEIMKIITTLITTLVIVAALAGLSLEARGFVENVQAAAVSVAQVFNR
jgi:hypothetical protein